MKTFDVRVWELRESRNAKNGGGKSVPHVVRWKVAGHEKSRTFVTKALATSFRSKLISALNDGQPFDTDSCLPDSMIEAAPAAPAAETTWLEFTARYVDMKWKTLAAKSRATTVEALAALLPGLAAEVPGRPKARLLRWALRRWYLTPAARTEEPESIPDDARRAIDWLKRASIPINETATAARAGLEAMTTALDGKPYAPDVIKRRRRILTNLVRYAIEREELTDDPFARIGWNPPKTSIKVDRRRVPNPKQVAALLVAVSYIGSFKRARGRRLVTFFGCMYYAMMRPEEVIGLRLDDCELPATGWGALMPAKTHPNAGKQWTDSGDLHDEKGLKQRADGETRRIPIPPVLVRLLREHIDTFGVAKDGRLFQSERGSKIAASSYSRAWRQARPYALPPDRCRSTLAAEPYDLRHAGISLALRTTHDPVLIAERAGNSADVLMKRYAWALDDADAAANRAIDEALGDDDQNDGLEPPT